MMVKTTRAQREALARLFSRIDARPEKHEINKKGWIRRYRKFRESVQPYFDGSGCIIVRWCGSMWVGIETDGYTHS